MNLLNKLGRVFGVKREPPIAEVYYNIYALDDDRETPPPPAAH